MKMKQIFLINGEYSHFLDTLSETGEGTRGDQEHRLCACRQRHDLRGKNHCCKGTTLTIIHLSATFSNSHK